ncbi:MAG: hypothetical protein R2748_19930 [Bryobacterales bacterium]
MILGNLNLIGWHFMSGFKNDEMLALAAEIGVILLLFEVGLESNIDELLAWALRPCWSRGPRRHRAGRVGLWRFDLLPAG